MILDYEKLKGQSCARKPKAKRSEWCEAHVRTATAHRRGEIKFKAIERYTLHVNPVKAPPHAPAITRNSYGSRHTLAVYYRTARLLLLHTAKLLA